MAAIRYSQKNWELEIDVQSKEYWRWRDKILYTEEHLLEALCFDLEVAHPYPLLVDLVKRVTPGNSALGQCAWAFVNDRYDLHFLYRIHKQSSDGDANPVSSGGYCRCGLLFRKKVHKNNGPGIFRWQRMVGDIWSEIG